MERQYGTSGGPTSRGDRLTASAVMDPALSALDLIGLRLSARICWRVSFSPSFFFSCEPKRGKKGRSRFKGLKKPSLLSRPEVALVGELRDRLLPFPEASSTGSPGSTSARSANIGVGGVRGGR